MKSIKLYSEGGKSLKAFGSHYGRHYYGWDYVAKTGVNHNHNWQAIKNHLTQEPIMHLPNNLT